MEPTFCQIYAALCHDLHQVLPDLEESSDAGAGHSSRPVRFNLRALLLNKCQSEFEKGLAGMAELPKVCPCWPWSLRQQQALHELITCSASWMRMVHCRPAGSSQRVPCRLQGSNSSALASPEQGHSSGGTCQPQILVEENGFKVYLVHKFNQGCYQVLVSAYIQGNAVAHLLLNYSSITRHGDQF